MERVARSGLSLLDIRAETLTSLGAIINEKCGQDKAPAPLPIGGEPWRDS